MTSPPWHGRTEPKAEWRNGDSMPARQVRQGTMATWDTASICGLRGMPRNASAAVTIQALALAWRINSCIPHTYKSKPCTARGWPSQTTLRSLSGLSWADCWRKSLFLTYVFLRSPVPVTHSQGGYQLSSGSRWIPSTIYHWQYHNRQDWIHKNDMPTICYNAVCTMVFTCIIYMSNCIWSQWSRIQSAIVLVIVKGEMVNTVCKILANYL